MKISQEELREEIRAILYPEPDETEGPNLVPPHKRLREDFALDTWYFQPPWSIQGDRKYEHLVEDSEDSVHKIIESVSVPKTLFDASLNLFAESLITYNSDNRTWGVYRYYPSILMTVWAAFESWVRLTSELFNYLLMFRRVCPQWFQMRFRGVLSQPFGYSKDRVLDNRPGQGFLVQERAHRTVRKARLEVISAVLGCTEPKARTFISPNHIVQDTPVPGIFFALPHPRIVMRNSERGKYWKSKLSNELIPNVKKYLDEHVGSHKE